MSQYIMAAAIVISFGCVASYGDESSGKSDRIGNTEEQITVQLEISSRHT